MRIGRLLLSLTIALLIAALDIWFIDLPIWVTCIVIAATSSIISFWPETKHKDAEANHEEQVT